MTGQDNGTTKSVDVEEGTGVADDRHGSTRRNNPPASLAAVGRVPQVEPIR